MATSTGCSPVSPGVIGMTEYRCPDCGCYCRTHPLDERAYCSSDGWFEKAETPHIIQGDA